MKIRLFITGLLAGLFMVASAITHQAEAQSSRNVPIGTIVAFAGEKEPPGWIFCRGQEIPKARAYEALRKVLGADKAPDLQGYFLRGLDDKGRIDPGRKLLDVQADAVGPHTHSYSIPTRGTTGKSGAEPPDVWPHQSAAANTSDPMPKAGETRPKNVAVNFIIKAF